MGTSDAHAEPSFEDYVKNSISTVTSVGNYLVYPFMIGAATLFSFTVSEEQGCGNFLGVFINSGGCNFLKNLLILNSWAAMGEGIILSDLSICFAAIGIVLGSFQYLYHKAVKKNERNSGFVDFLDIESAARHQRDLQESLLTGEYKQKGLRLKTTSLIERIHEISWYAVAENKSAMIIFGLIGSFIWQHVTRQILDMYGCRSVGFFDLFWFVHLSGRLKGKCNAGNTYWAMTGCAYGLAFAIVAGLTTWWWSVTSQLFFKKPLTGFIKPFIPYVNLMDYIPGLNAFFRFTKRTLGSKGLNHESNRNFFQAIELGVKLVGILFSVGLLPLTIYEGVSFGDSVLEQFACKGLTVIKIVAANAFDMNKMLCMWGLQLLGIDAAPTDTEVYNILPGMLFTALAGTILGLCVHAVNMGSASPKIGSWLRVLDDIYSKASFMSVLAFIPITAWGIFFCAIPKYNQVVQMDANCAGFTFPTSLWGFVGTKCPASKIYAGIAAYVSTKWIVFFNFAAIAFSAGVLGRSVQLGIQYGRGSKSPLFQPALDKESVTGLTVSSLKCS